MYFFFFNDTATTEIYTLSLHDALPIYVSMAAVVLGMGMVPAIPAQNRLSRNRTRYGFPSSEPFLQADRFRLQKRLRSEEHTSELQSRSDLVCRLLLEEKDLRVRAD